MTKVTRTFIDSTVISGYSYQDNTKVLDNYEVEGSVADPASFGKKTLKLAKNDSFIVTDVVIKSSLYEMDVETFKANATKVEK